jgi:hypothetical protein
MNHIDNRLLYGLYGVVILFGGGLTFYLGANLVRIIHTENKSSSIDFKVHTCFDKTIRKQFSDEVNDTYYNSILDRYEATISVQKRWEMDGKWQKALEERC